MSGVWGLVAAAVLTFGADQTSKAAVVARLAEGERRPLFGPIRLRRVTNPVGSLVGFSVPWAVALLLVVAVGSVVLVVDGPLWSALGMGAALGGGTGNVLDRLRRGGVVDFLDIGRWPTFNVADVALVVGGAVAIVGALGA